MKKIALAVVVAAVGAAALVPVAAAEQLHANVVSWSPNDVELDEPVAVVLVLYVAGPSPYPQDGKPVAGVNDVEVVIRGDGQERRFPTEDIGGGHYRTEISFPAPGDWALRVSYGSGRYGPSDEVVLGKGSIRIEAASTADESGRSSSTPLYVVAAASLILALAIGLMIWRRRSGRRQGRASASLRRGNGNRLSVRA